MGYVQQAVLEFDEEIQAPWRPRLVSVSETPTASSAGVPAARPPLGHPSRHRPSRVGVCRPPASPARPSGLGRRVAARPLGRGVPPRAAGGMRPTPHRTRPAPLRLTRRARRLAAVLGLAVGVALGSWLGPLLGAGGGDLRLAGESAVVVQSGDTLWSIASSLDPDGDVRALIDEIQELNGLRGSDLRPGQTLLVP